MRSTLRQIVRSILAEGVRSTGMTTRDWWSRRGVNYVGEQADSMYFVYTDDAGNEIVGSQGEKGDPFTYLPVGDGKFRVTSGPIEKSIGAIISQQQRSERKAGRSTADSSASKDSESSAQQDTVKMFSACIIEAMFNIIMGMVEQQKLKDYATAFQDKIPDLKTNIEQNSIGGFFGYIIGPDIGSTKIEIRSSSQKSDLEQDIKNLIAQLDQMPDIISSISSAASESFVQGRIMAAKLYLTKSIPYLRKINSRSLTNEEIEYLFQGEQIRDFAAKVATSDDTITYFKSNLTTSPRIGRIAINPAGYVRERLYGYEPENLRKEVGKLRMILLDKLGMVPQ